MRPPGSRQGKRLSLRLRLWSAGHLLPLDADEEEVLLHRQSKGARLCERPLSRHVAIATALLVFRRWVVSHEP